MIVAPVPAHERERLAALNSYGVLDSEPEQAFDALTLAAAAICGTPISLVSLIDHDRQWFKSVLGLAGVSETPRDMAFCSHAILGHDILEVCDARKDDRFHDNPAVIGDPNIRFYAGVPLIDAENFALGTLCVLGHKPQRLTAQQRQVLVELAKAAVRLIEASRDNARRKEAEREQARLNERIRLATEAGRVGIWEMRIAEQEFFGDDWMRQLYGIDPSLRQPEPHDWGVFIHHDDFDGFQLDLFAAIAGGPPFDKAYRVVWPSGEVRHLCARGTIVRDDSGTPDRMVGVVWDVTELRTLADQLHEEKERLQITLLSIGDAVVATDEKSRVTFMNPVAERLLGWSAAEAFARPLSEIFHLIDEETATRLPHPAQRRLAHQSVQTEDRLSLISRDGNRYAIQKSVGPVRTRSGEIIGAVIVFQDVSRARELQKALHFAASHDALTGLFNRAKFEAECEAALTLVKRSHARHTICFLDLDRFKIVNDTAGHAAGDALLREVAATMLAGVRSTDTIARLGGDEFGLLLRDCPLDRAQATCEKLIAAISAIRIPWKGGFCDVGASIGIAPITTATSSIGEMMIQADVACYASKHAGRNRASFYDQSAAGLQHREVFQAAGLCSALEENRFILYAQDIVPTAGLAKDVRHIEILLRMIDEKGDIIPPSAFIPAAERFDLMSSIDRWVISQTLINFGPAIADHPNLRIAVNLSANSLSDAKFLPYVLAVIRQSAIRPEAIQFEITETAIMKRLNIASRFIDAVRNLGCTIALDDFGSGASSFTYLKSFTADFIKIDGSFVRNMVVSPTDWVIVESINALAHQLGSKTVAEFVETKAILKTLREIGVDYAQGHSIARPVPLRTRLRNFASHARKHSGVASNINTAIIG